MMAVTGAKSWPPIAAAIAKLRQFTQRQAKCNPPASRIVETKPPVGLVSKDGRAVVLDGGFAATKAGGSWAPGLGVASFDELNDEFTRVPDTTAAAFAREARTALAGPVGFVSKDGRAAVIDVGGWAASKLGGSWVPGLKFSPDNLNDDFSAPPDKVAAALVKEARTALTEAFRLDVARIAGAPEETPEQIRAKYGLPPAVPLPEGFQPLDPAIKKAQAKNLVDSLNRNAGKD